MDKVIQSLAIELGHSPDQYHAIGVSTAHLSESDRRTLHQLANDPECNMVMSRDTGWFIKLFDEPEYNVQHADMSHELQRLLVAARYAGYRLVEFDRDANTYQHAATFPWG